MVPNGVAEREKSAKKIAKARVTVCCPDVPVTVRFNGLALDAVSPVTVTTLDCPAVIVVGLKAQVAPLPPQVSEMLWPNEVAAEAATVNVVEVVPIVTTLDRVFAERLN